MGRQGHPERFCSLLLSSFARFMLIMGTSDLFRNLGFRRALQKFFISLLEVRVYSQVSSRRMINIYTEV